jgi:hypothetical protein
MKRIALAHNEFLAEGLHAALHVNGRTETDFMRWAECLSEHPEITTLAYEFTTGASSAGRREQHTAWLCTLAKTVARPLRLLLRGSADGAPECRRAFDGVTVIETTAFVKTMKRQRAYSDSASRIHWKLDPTPIGAPLDDLLRYNLRVVSEKFAFNARKVAA